MNIALTRKHTIF